jgi:hypothetical protein
VAGLALLASALLLTPAVAAAQVWPRGPGAEPVARARAQATPGAALERLALLSLLEEGLARAAGFAARGGPEAPLALGPRDTLYLYDLVHGNVKVIATSPRGGPVRRRLALRLLAGAGDDLGLSRRPPSSHGPVDRAGGVPAGDRRPS